MTGVTAGLLVGMCLCLCDVWTLELSGELRKFSNLWVAKIEGGEEVAQRIATDLGYTYKGQCGELKDYYELMREDHPEMSIRDSSHLTSSLLELDEVKWAKQQMLIKKDNYGIYQWFETEEQQQEKLMEYLKKEAERQEMDINFKMCKSFFSCITYYPASIFWYLKSTGQGDFSKLGTISTKPVSRAVLSKDHKPTRSINLISRKVSAYTLKYNDPSWKKQWYLQDYRTSDIPVMDHNVVPVHNMKYTGKNVVVAVVDSGVEHNNFDYKNNFIERLSYDICKDQPGSHPVGSHHGTHCAGIIAMTPNNKQCGVGIAFDAKIVGIRALCSTEQVEASSDKAMVHAHKEVDIYSMSFGYVGSGFRLFSRSHLTERSYIQGTSEGRHGKGVIYVRASGNDKDDGDNCGVDPEMNTPYAVVIGGVDQNGKAVYYSERCTAILATAYTDNMGLEGIVAPKVKSGCVNNFGGTSAACPVASGTIALLLEANPSLTYRDVMHVITMSAEVAPLANNDGWYKNGQGFWVSNDFGFGLLNAENMVNVAQNWRNVDERQECIVTISIDGQAILRKGDPVIVPFETEACQGTPDEVNYLEHIELTSTVQYTPRGAIMIFIESPAKTKSQLLEYRSRDGNKDGFNGLTITSTHNWGERPEGTWTVTYKVTSGSDPQTTGTVDDLTMKFYGTRTKPHHYKQKREYAAFRLASGETS